MSQSGDNPTSGITDCSEAMEALRHIEGIIREQLAKSQSHPERDSDARWILNIVEKAMAADAGNRAVQKTHPSNQDLFQLVEPICDVVRSEIADKFKDGTAKSAGILAVNMVSYEVYRLAGKLDCGGRAEGHNTAQAHDGR